MESDSTAMLRQSGRGSEREGGRKGEEGKCQGNFKALFVADNIVGGSDPCLTGCEWEKTSLPSTSFSFCRCPPSSVAADGDGKKLLSLN